jgi:hypothetical protein
MKQQRRQSFFAMIVLGLLLAIVLPTTALGQGRGRGRDKNNDSNFGWQRNKLSKHDRKCAKFRNCHDARDGRWDNRGPRANRVGFVVRNRNRQDNNYSWRNRVRRIRRNR